MIQAYFYSCLLNKKAPSKLNTTVTARNIQKNEHQWYRAKSFDTFGPIGPVIAIKDKIPDPQNLNLKSYVNGKLRQDGNM